MTLLYIESFLIIITGLTNRVQSHLITVLNAYGAYVEQGSRVKRREHHMAPTKYSSMSAKLWKLIPTPIGAANQHFLSGIFPRVRRSGFAVTTQIITGAPLYEWVILFAHLVRRLLHAKDTPRWNLTSRFPSSLSKSPVKLIDRESWRSNLMLILILVTCFGSVGMCWWLRSSLSRIYTLKSLLARHDLCTIEPTTSPCTNGPSTQSRPSKIEPAGRYKYCSDHVEYKSCPYAKKTVPLLTCSPCSIFSLSFPKHPLLYQVCVVGDTQDQWCPQRGGVKWRRRAWSTFLKEKIM